MIKLPEHIEAEMRRYLHGTAPLPQSYVDFHVDMAMTDLAARDWHVVGHDMVGDGWGDSMRVVRVFLSTGEELRWHESGAWFRRAEGGGMSRFCEAA